MKTIRPAKKTFLLGSFTVLLALAVVPFARATLIVVDQQNNASGGTLGTGVSNGGSLGQSFTPALPSLNAVDLPLQTLNVSETLQLTLLQGAGLGGTVLGTAAPLVLTQNFSRATTQEFTFAAPIVLTPGNVYTFKLTETAFVPFSGSDFGFYPVVTQSDTYAGGQFFLPDGSAFTGGDAVFAEGLTAAGVGAPAVGLPEPSAWATLILGAGLLTLLGRARRRLAA